MKWLLKKVNDNWEICYRTDSKAKPRGGEYLLVEGASTKYPKLLTDENGLMTVIESNEPKQLAEAYVDMDEGIVADAAAIFGTSNRESLLAFVDDFQMRIMSPHLFLADEEFAQLNTASYGEGEPLDTVEKIKGYYEEVLYDLLQKRRAKMGTYVATKAGLGL